MSDVALQTTLESLLAERHDLDVAIGVICKRLGIDPPPSGGGGRGSSFARSGGGGGGDPVTGTTEGEYFGFVSTKAALEILKKFGARQRPLKTKDIYDAITKGGVEIGTEDALYRSLSRSHTFKKVGRGLWGLTEWYPPTTKKPKVDAQGKPLPADAADDFDAFEGDDSDERAAENEVA